MLSFLRSLTKSRVGLIVVFLLLGVIAIAFGMSDVTGLRSSGAGSGEVVARVGREKITADDVRQRIENVASNMRAQGQQFDMQAFLAQGGLDFVLNQMIDEASIREFGRENGMFVSKRTIDGEIASNPAFQGPDGKFDPALFSRLLSSRRIPEQAVRDEIRDTKYRSWLLSPVLGAQQVPDTLLTPYAAMALERRSGSVAYIPARNMDAGAAPDPKAIQQYYDRNKARYTIPERRVLRYTTIHPDALRAGIVATDADIAQAYKAAGARFAAKEQRSVKQVIVADKTAADALAKAVRSGKSIDEAARSAGLEAASFGDMEKTALAAQTAPAVADAAFQAKQGDVLGPIQSPIGYHIVRVEKVTALPAKTVEQAKPELAKEVVDRKTTEALIALHDKLDDGVANSATFDELMKANKLQASTSPALLASGIDPSNPVVKPDESFVPVVKAGFAMDVGDDPQLVALGQDGSFAVVTVAKIVPATLRPLADVKAAVEQDYRAEQQYQKARSVAAEMVRQLNRGAPMPQAVAAAGVPLPSPQRFDLSQAQLSGRQVPAPIVMAFNMAPKRAKLVEAENRSGYYVVWLENIDRKDATGNADAIASARRDLAPLVGGEYARQFVASIRTEVKVTRDEPAIKRLHDNLAQQGVSGR